MKSSWYSLIPFLPFLLSHLRLPAISITRPSSLLTTVLYSLTLSLLTTPSTLLLLLLSCWTLLITSLDRPNGKHSLYFWSVFTEPLHSSGRGADPTQNSLYYWGLFTVPLLSNGYTRHSILRRYLLGQSSQGGWHRRGCSTHGRHQKCVKDRVGKSGRDTYLEKHMYRYEDNIKMYI
jgi:hypothetical protein